ncbi:MAG: hypothetical protein C4321_10260 [Chloroflexota bacterium]
MAWVVGVEVPDELAQQELRVLDSEGNSLEEDQLRDLHWPLTDPLGAVTVRWSDEQGMEAERRFESSSHRVFKLARSRERGRRVSGVTRGNYVVIAPRTLKRSEAVGGAPPVAPENVFPEQAGMLAHHLLVLGKAEGLVLVDESDSASVEVRPSTATAYELIGHVIEDAHTRAGPLFGREPPRFRVEGAAQPARFVVGVEGPSLGRRPRQAATELVG